MILYYLNEKGVVEVLYVVHFSHVDTAVLSQIIE